MQDIAPFSYQHTRYSTKAHDISFFLKNKNKTNHTFMQAERKLNQNTYDKKKKKKHFILQDSLNRVEPFIQLSYKIWSMMHTPVLIC